MATAPAALGAGLVMTLTVVLSLTAYTVDGFLPAFPAAAAAFGTAPSTMQLSITSFLLGVAGGQLVFGPLSDRLGRRTPLLAGAAVCTIAATVCALAPDVTVFIAARFVQGAAGSAGVVLSKAIVRDRTSGVDTARALALVAVGSGVLIIFAPAAGGLMAALFGWRGPLWFIAASAFAVFVLIAAVVPETHSPERREAVRWLGVPSVVRHLRNRGFVLYTVIQAASYGALLSYVAASPFVYQEVLGFDAFTYGVIFSVNAFLAVLGNFVANRMLRGVPARRLILVGFAGSLVGSVATAALWLLQAPPEIVAIAITCSMCTLSLNGPNLIGLALNRVTSATGSAAGTIGFVQFCAGSAVSPIVGLWGADTLVPMVVCMLVLVIGGGTALVAFEAAERRALSLAR